jgi:hypothetical protein
MKTLILWESNLTHTPVDPKERIGLWLKMLDGVKKGVESGITETWGISPSGDSGFSISNQSEQEILTNLAAYSPYVKFKVMKMLSVDEAIAAVKALKKQME